MVKRSGTSLSSQRSRLILGRAAFQKISAVDGIIISPMLDDDLRALADAPAEHRRSVLAAKYGKR